MEELGRMVGGGDARASGAGRSASGRGLAVSKLGAGGFVGL